MASNSRPEFQLADRKSPLLRARSALLRLLVRARRPVSRQTLRTTIGILKAQQEATLDGILVVDRTGRILSYNRRFLEIWGIPDSVAQSGDDNELLGYAADRVADWDGFIEQVNYLYAHPEEVRTADVFGLKDGRILSRSSVPVRAEGAIKGRAWYFRDITEAERAKKLESALYRIAELSRSTAELDQFYRSLHAIVGELMDATNFYVAELDQARNLLTFRYFSDVYEEKPNELPTAGGLTDYVLRTGEPLLATPEVFELLVRTGKVRSLGVPSVDWLGVPLKTGDRTWGVLAVQSYEESVRFDPHHKEILLFVAGQVSLAIEQKRQEDALRASELRYRQMFENNRAVQLVIDPETGSIVDANMAAADYYGYTRDELRRMRIYDINVLDRESIFAEMAKARAQERSYFLFRHMRSNGEVRDVEVHSGPIELGGRPMLYSIVHDVTERIRAERALLASEEKYRNIFDYASVGIYQSTLEGRFLAANATLARMLGYEDASDLLSRRLDRDIYVDPAEREELIRVFGPRGYASDYEVRWKKKDGTPIWVQLNAHAIRGAGGEMFFEGFVYDITERKRAEERLAASNEQLRRQSAAMTASMDGIGILDERLEFTYSNDALAKLFGFSAPRELIGASLCDLYEPPEQVRFVTTIVPVVQQRGRWRGEATGVRRDGSTFPQEISLTAIDRGAMVAVVRDITERTYAEEQIKHLAYHDALTGLPNRLLFKDRLSVALSHAQRSGTRLAVLFLDLDRFKIINDSLGHNTGDQLLQAVSTRLHACIRDSDTLARFGGDEFTLLLPNLARSDDVVPIAQKILESLRHPFSMDEREIFTSTSIGISLYPEDGADAESLIKNADTAMYQAKEQGRDNYQLFNAFVSARALQRIALEHALRRAIANDELEIHYQPIYDFRTARVAGMEALLRWRSPEHGLVSPGTFIPIAEATGLMPSLGAWVLRTACSQARSWHEAGFEDLTLAVNLSVTQLQSGDLLERVRDALAVSRMDPRLLELEITESGAMQSPETSLRTLNEIKNLGIRISLDDFGTGHSSLAYLRRFPIDTVKIDQSFVHDISQESGSPLVVAIIAMSHSLHLRVVAEGVENEAQMEFLRRHECDQMQGYLLRPPLPAADFLGCIDQRHRKG